MLRLLKIRSWSELDLHKAFQLCRVVLRCVVFRCVVLYCVALCFVALCCVVCDVLLCCVVLLCCAVHVVSQPSILTGSHTLVPKTILWIIWEIKWFSLSCNVNVSSSVHLYSSSFVHVFHKYYYRNEN